MTNRDTEYLLIRYREIKQDIDKVDDTIEYLQNHRKDLLLSLDCITTQIIDIAYPIHEK